MNKIISLLCIILLCFTLTACDPGSFIIEEDYLEDVIAIELIEYDNPNQKSFFTWVPNQFDELKPFEITNYRVLEELPEEKIDEFLLSFQETDILHTYYAYDSPKDICIK